MGTSDAFKPDRMDIHSQYNEEPVYYCSRCMSLNIRHIDSLQDSEYCNNCGSTVISTSTIEDWEKSFKDRFGYNYLENY